MDDKKRKPIRAALRRLLFFLIENVSVTCYIICFISTVTLSGIIYYFLTPTCHGIGNNGLPIENLSFLNAMYFSIVTVSSLGYGDMHPMGISKTLACLEVLFGLILMGIMLAKITSARLSYHVRRLFMSETQKRIECYAEEFGTLDIQLIASSKKITQSFQKTPDDNVNNSSTQSEAISECTKTISSFHSRSSGLAEYISYEVEHCDFFSIAPIESMTRMAQAIDKVISRLVQMIIIIPNDARDMLLGPDNMKRLLRALDEQKRICGTVRQHCIDSSIKDRFLEILRDCESFPEQFFAVPSPISEITQPDQKIVESNEPQS